MTYADREFYRKLKLAMKICDIGTDVYGVTLVLGILAGVLALIFKIHWLRIVAQINLCVAMATLTLCACISPP
jgi:hypothetical protein